ncbi:MAG TPA: hypothetical protein VE133_15430, partial [Candidatus Sulfotelmatobacter sp.]|nr:hypothetical protein [Candidatus Sulfotelmatobacter sp.]
IDVACSLPPNPASEKNNKGVRSGRERGRRQKLLDVGNILDRSFDGAPARTGRQLKNHKEKLISTELIAPHLHLHFST